MGVLCTWVKIKQICRCWAVNCTKMRSRWGVYSGGGGRKGVGISREGRKGRKGREEITTREEREGEEKMVLVREGG